MQSLTLIGEITCGGSTCQSIIAELPTLVWERIVIKYQKFKFFTCGHSHLMAALTIFSILGEQEIT